MEQPKLQRDTHDMVTDVLLVGLFPFFKIKAILFLEAQTVYLIFILKKFYTVTIVEKALKITNHHRKDTGHSGSSLSVCRLRDGDYRVFQFAPLL